MLLNLLAAYHVNILTLSAFLAVASMAAGFLGSLTGLGGGVIIVPLLVLGLGVDIHYAAGASLVSVIATSSGAAAAYVRQRLTNVRIGMLLEIATTIGAVSGAYIALIMNPSLIAIIFGALLIFSAALSHKDEENSCAKPKDRLATALKLNGSYHDTNGATKCYNVYNVPGGFALMFVAGALSGLLGIGSGAMKVLAMDRIMRIPFRVSSTTSNFMIGVTAVASAGIYFTGGYVDPGLALPVMLGVLAGSLLGARTLAHADTGRLRIIFRILLAAVAVQMIVKGLMGVL